MTQPLHVREQAFRLATEVASLSFSSAIGCAADMIRMAAKSDAFLAALQDQPRATLETLADLVQATTDPPSQLP